LSGVFGDSYASTYDAVYAEKDYESECDLVERLLREYSDVPARAVLDLGCGTGGHALPLAARGYEVVGVDRSEAMLELARLKAVSVASSATFRHGDLRDVRIDRAFDAVLILFAVLGYQTGNDDVLAALRTAHAHLRPGGLLLFDVWYGPAVLRMRPAQRFKVIDTTRGRILRLSDGALDVARHVCDVDVHFWDLDGERLAGESEERHSMRFFFPLELELMLDVVGFQLVRLGNFPDFDRAADETTWSVLAVAQAVS
jgi:SAM-dependent methyltransferase